MVFKQHMGIGPGLPNSTGNMPNLWESCWTDWQQSCSDLKQSEHWPWLQRYLPPPARVLEGGCGLAKWVWFLANQGYEAYGIDFSKKAIEVSLSKWPDLKLAVGDLRDMSYHNGFFDGIISLGAIEHDEEGPDAALREMHRVLRPGGVLYCTVPCENILGRLGLLALRDWRRRNRTIRWLKGIKYDSMFWQYLWTRKEYAEILANAGFVIIRLEPLNPEGLFLGRPGSLQNRIVNYIHRSLPWFVPHMMAAICRKP